HHLRRLRDDADLRPDRGRREEDRARRQGAAEGGDLRPRAHAQPAARALGLERHERDRAFGGGAVRAGCEPGDLAHGGGGDSRPREGTAIDHSRTKKPFFPFRSPVRRLALRHRARLGRHGAAPQALPRARRQLQSSARGDALDRAAARDAVQPGRGARGDGAGRTGIGQLLCRGRDFRSRTASGPADAPLRPWVQGEGSRARGAHRDRNAIPESAQGRVRSGARAFAQRLYRSTPMIAVIFEFTPNEGRFPDYMAVVDTLREDLAKADGFIGLERFESITTKGRFLSLQFWRDDESVRKWRNLQKHREAQKKGRATIFKHYRLRIATVLRDYEMDKRAQAPHDSVAVHG